MILRRHRAVAVAIVAVLVLGATGLAVAAPGRGEQAAIAPAATNPEGFVGLSPVRVLDTRTGDGPIGIPAAAPIAAGQEISLPLTTAAPNRPSAPVPANAVSVLLNITIDNNATAASFEAMRPVIQL